MFCLSFQRCGTGCSCGVSSPRSSSTAPRVSSCWSRCSATRGAASSPWCWSAWASWPRCPGASSPVGSKHSARLGSIVFSYGSSIRSLSLGANTGEEGGGGGQLEAEGARRVRLAWQLLSNRGRLRGADREGSSRDFVFNRLGLVLWHRML